MTTKRLKVAGAGAGYYARFHVEAWKSIGRVDYAGICDADPDKARGFAQRLGLAGSHAGLAEMLDELQPDLLDIVTPPESHLEVAKAAFERGIAVVCQKPLAPSLAEAIKMVEQAEQHGVPLFVHENFRFRPWFRETADLLRQNRIGTVHALSFRLRPGDGQGADAYLHRQPYFRRMERFLVHETAIHFIDTFRFLLGEISAVTSRLRRLNPGIAGEDAGYIIFEFENGSTALFDGNRLNTHPADNPALTMGEMWLEGSAGVLRLDGSARLWWAPHGQPETEHHYPRHEQLFAGGAVHALQARLADCLLDNTTMENSGRDYLANIRVEEAVYRSNAEGRRITLERPTRSTPTTRTTI